jgi:hypothetical protein
MPYPAYSRLNLWQAPDYLVWGVIGCGLLMLVPDGFAKTIGLNGLITLMMIYFFQGVAIVSFFFRKETGSAFCESLAVRLARFAGGIAGGYCHRFYRRVGQLPKS